MVRNGCGQSSHRTLKLAVSQEWINGMNSFFACWFKLKKAKSDFKDFWVCLAQNGQGNLVQETLKSAEWVYGMSWFLACWLWCHNFWLDQHHTFYLWRLNVSLLHLYLLAPWYLIAGRILWNRVCSSFPPEICQGVFLEFDHEISLKNRVFKFKEKIGH